MIEFLSFTINRVQAFTVDYLKGTPEVVRVFGILNVVLTQLPKKKYLTNCGESNLEPWTFHAISGQQHNHYTTMCP